MKANIQKTYVPKPGELPSKWHIVDAKGKTLGRMATEIAILIRGKHKPEFAPHVDCGDHVIVINATQVELTGRKLVQKEYHHYSGTPGGLKSFDAATIRANDPERMIRHAVRGMLPKNVLSLKLINHLKVYPGAEHPHAAQKPEPFQVA